MMFITWGKNHHQLLPHPVPITAAPCQCHPAMCCIKCDAGGAAQPHFTQPPNALQKVFKMFFNLCISLQVNNFFYLNAQTKQKQLLNIHFQAQFLVFSFHMRTSSSYARMPASCSSISDSFDVSISKYTFSMLTLHGDLSHAPTDF